jgi:hypothetical protein
MGDFGAPAKFGYKTLGPDDVARGREALARLKGGKALPSRISTRMGGADFGGVSYTTGDFVTPGTSGLGEMGLLDIKPNLTNTRWVIKKRKSAADIVKEKNAARVRAIDERLTVIQKEISLLPQRKSALESEAITLRRERASLTGENLSSPVLTTLNGMGDFWSDTMQTIFGKEGAAQVTQTLQSGAATAVTNVVGSKLGTNPAAQEAIKKTGVETVKAVFNEYWYISYPLTIALVGTFGYGIYNMIKARKQ